MLHEWIYWNLYLNFFEKIEHFRDSFCDLNYEYANIKILKYDNLKFAQTIIYKPKSIGSQMPFVCYKGCSTHLLKRQLFLLFKNYIM